MGIHNGSISEESIIEDERNDGGHSLPSIDRIIHPTYGTRSLHFLSDNGCFNYSIWALFLDYLYLNVGQAISQRFIMNIRGHRKTPMMTPMMDQKLMELKWGYDRFKFMGFKIYHCLHLRLF